MTNKRRRTAVPAVLLLGLGLAGCGSGADEPAAARGAPALSAAPDARGGARPRLIVKLRAGVPAAAHTASRRLGALRTRHLGALAHGAVAWAVEAADGRTGPATEDEARAAAEALGRLSST